MFLIKGESKLNVRVLWGDSQFLSINIATVGLMYSSKTAFSVLLHCLFATANYTSRGQESARLSVEEGTPLVKCKVRHTKELAHALEANEISPRIGI